MQAILFKDTAGIALDLATISAIAVGGIWTYLLFVRQRLKYPAAVLSHDMSHWNVTDDKVLLRLVLKVENTGKVLLSPSELEAWVQQVMPCPSYVSDFFKKDKAQKGREVLELPWNTVDEVKKEYNGKSFEVEPGEFDELIIDFVLPVGLRGVSVYTHLINPVKKRRNVLRRSKERTIGWTKTTIYRL